MPLNLISEAWIPVLTCDGHRTTIAPWEMANNNILRPDWPRADLNIACYEFLIGLVYLADPPADKADWHARRPPDPDRLRARLDTYAAAFNLTGEGPLFLQELGAVDGTPNSPDMLFIDSAGGNTAKNNADLMVHRERYQALGLPLAAMALYAFQAHAPSGGAGNRTSLRGGGPTVTLVDPGEGLWALVWANVPYGNSGEIDDLPWMRETRTSEKGSTTELTFPPHDRTFGVETFFGMPRRLSLIGKEQVTGVVQKPWGTNYALWAHPLTPYYRQKEGAEWLPQHPRAGRFGYRNWLGIVVRDKGDEPHTERALCLREWMAGRGGDVNVIVAGWSMDNMKPRDFTWSVAPALELSPEAAFMLVGLILAADAAGGALRVALAELVAKGETLNGEVEAFFVDTEGAFHDCLRQLKSGEPSAAIAALWREALKNTALTQFDTQALPQMDRRDMRDIEKLVAARTRLASAFAGYGAFGKRIFDELDLERPVLNKKEKAA